MSNNSSTMNGNSDRILIPVEDVCLFCGNQRLLRTSWTDPNPGRRFLGCTKAGCKGFDWVDPPMCRRAVQIIPGLLRKTNKLEIEVAKSRAKERKMKMYLAATWIIFAGVVFGNKVFAF
ncbi:hypothetical protein RHMOL_Rhmol01G0135300 [Rhododendron molle]|uniref:Uncharacterized protein n=1 Tax=Rhododendron molle TaxID=49168 RepID=A0ACC0Q2Z6_RHOML|nr:hypothetical protein RHMOL_Rhmol01G0135300 [Rhododendron molle]